MVSNMFFEIVFQELDGAYAPATLHGYRKDIRRISKWVISTGHDPERIGHPELIDYLENGCHGLAMATIKRSVAALGTIYKYAELPDPTKHPKVQLALRKLGRQRGSLQVQAKPLTKTMLDEFLSRCDPSTTMGRRDEVLLRLGYETMRRRGELVKFRFEDLRESANGTRGILLRSSKTDQLGRGRVIQISSELAELIESWKTLAGDGFILRNVCKDGTVGKSLTPESVNRILKRLEAVPGKIETGLSGHSFRVGRTIDMIADGATIDQVAITGGWYSSKTVYRYAQSWADIHT
jgi:site-specific recombinase XerD